MSIPEMEQTTRIQRIVSRCDSSKVLFECEVPEGMESGSWMRHALEKANLSGAYLSSANLSDADLSGADLSGADLRGANLRDAYLSDANLSDADLSGADLSDANLSDADLRGANLSGANLRGANLRGALIENVPAEKQIEALDKVREIILDNAARLNMVAWHENEEWKNHTCAEEAICGTTHCLAGWLQVCSTDPEIRKKKAEFAGFLTAPIAAPLFFSDSKTVLAWLKDRKYVKQLETEVEAT